jgi:outer membrane protein, heavy metal efflux system
MRTGTEVAAVCACIVLSMGTAAAQDGTLTLEEVLARVRTQAPQVVGARLALEESRGRLLGAAVRFQSNPELSVAVGNRNGLESRFTDFELGFGQNLEVGGRRSARMDSAGAAVSETSANIDEVTRAVLRSATTAYYRALHANERIRLLDGAFELASAVYSAADRRFKAGDIAVLDVNIARASLARVKAEREGAEAAKSLAIGELRQFLRIDGPLEVEGSLARPAAVDLDAALEAASGRPELRALDARIQEAEADFRLAQSFSKPEYGLGVRYSREEGDQILLGGVTVTLPVYAKGQEQRAVSSARAGRLRAELEGARSRIQLEVRAAFDSYSRRLAAVRVLETDAIPGLDENEQLTTRSFDVGQIGLPELLLIRREILDTRSQYLDALLEAALARTELDASAALLR